MSATTPINEIVPFKQYTAAAGATDFGYNWWIGNSGDVAVYKDGVLQTTGYTVSGVQEPTGGNVVFDAGLTGGEVITLLGSFDIERLTGYITGGSFRAESINLELSTHVAIMLQLNRDISRKLGIPDTSSIDPTNLGLPTPEDGKALVWSGTAGAMVNGPSVGDIALASTYASQAAASATAAATQAAATITIPSESLILAGASGNTTARMLEDWIPQFHVEGFGAVRSTTAPSSTVMTANVAAFQAALNAAAAVGGQVVASAGTYYLNGGITFNPAWCSFDGFGCTLDFTNMATTGKAITIAHTDLGYDYGHKQHAFRNVGIEGPSSTIGSSVGLDFNSSTSGSLSSRTTLYNVRVRNFVTNIYLRNRAYLIMFFSCDSANCTTHVWMPSGLSDYGENCSFFGCSFFNGGLPVLMENANGNLHFFGCSFDYNGASGWITVNHGQVDCHSCHFEDNATSWTQSPFQVDTSGSGNKPLLHLFGGRVLVNSAGPHSTISAIINIGAGGVARWCNVHLHNLATTASLMKTGTGRFFLAGSDGYTLTLNPHYVAALTDTDLNLFTDGGFEQASVKDLIAITADTATITSRVTGTNIAVAVSSSKARTGSQSLKMTKAGGISTAATVTVLAPIPPNCTPCGGFYYATNGTETGSVNISRAFYAVSGFDGNGLPVIAKRAIIGTSTPTLGAGNSAWTEFGFPNGGIQQAPAWATHMGFEFNMFGMSAGDLFVDDMILNLT